MNRAASAVVKTWSMCLATALHLVEASVAGEPVPERRGGTE
jgi:hypothetical protein